MVNIILEYEREIVKRVFRMLNIRLNLNIVWIYEGNFVEYVFLNKCICNVKICNKDIGIYKCFNIFMFIGG